MNTRTRYFLFQVPGWVLAAVLLAALHRWVGIPLWIAVTGWALFVVKDFVLYPLLRHAYETKSPTGAERLIGQLGIVRTALEPAEPEGYVQLAGELWQARADGQAEAVPAGSSVRVVGAEGLVLLVEPESPASGRVQEDAEV